MAVVLPSGTILLDINIFYGLIGLSIFSTMLTLFIVTFIKGKIPEAVPLMKAELLKRPWVHIHTSLNQLAFAAPKRSGEDAGDNCYEMDKFLGLKLVPNPEMVENTDNGRRIIHYYSKAAPPISAKEAAACRDVINHLNERGIRPTESLIDALFIADDEELQSWYGEDSEMLELILKLKLELQTKFIQDGQFIYQTVREFIFSASNETSRSLDEFKSIAHEQADERNRNLGSSDEMKKNLLYFTIVIVVLAVGYKIMVA